MCKLLENSTPIQKFKLKIDKKKQIKIALKPKIRLKKINF